MRCGEYKFYTVSDDGIRLTIDGYTIIDNWVPHRLTEDSVVICLDKGWHKIVIEYNDIGFGRNSKAIMEFFIHEKRGSTFEPSQFLRPTKH